MSIPGQEQAPQHGTVANHEAPAATPKSAATEPLKMLVDREWVRRAGDMPEIGDPILTPPQMATLLAKQQRLITDLLDALKEIDAMPGYVAPVPPRWVDGLMHRYNKALNVAADAIAKATDEPPCTDCGGTGITYQTERPCACSLTDEEREAWSDIREGMNR